MFFDSHSHLQDDVYIDDLEEVIKAANENNVNYMMILGYDKESNEKALELAKKYDNIYAALGFHPAYINEVEETHFLWLEENLKHPKVKAIGEIGLDYYWYKDNKDLQKKYFERQLKFATKHNIPVIIHNREATEDIYNILKKYSLSGVMHSFSSSKEMAKKFIQIGMLIGISGVVTFKNAKKIKEVVEEIDLSHILIETDSPYLTPEPYRGKRNEPKYVILVADEIAKIKNISKEEVGKITTENALKVFNIK
ncbi:MAG TPA: TatD family hydrolase [Tenericutes bacterium]|nr:TatD family hydrolase [Mycoplasmatota bacterium]